MLKEWRTNRHRMPRPALVSVHSSARTSHAKSKVILKREVQLGVEHARSREERGKRSVTCFVTANTFV